MDRNNQIRLTLHKTDNYLLLDSQELRQAMCIDSPPKARFFGFIEKFCEYLNYSVTHSGEAFCVAEHARLEAWVEAYCYAKNYKHEIVLISTLTEQV